jgi:lycopene cyclase domain-containing protein
MPAEYLLLMAACIAITLPLEFVLGARVYRQPRRTLLALLPLLLIFSVWDAVAIARGHWDYSPAHTTGWLLPFGIPVEEVVFFIVIPLCGLLTYEAVGQVLARRNRAAPASSAPTPSAPTSAPGSRNVPPLPELREEGRVSGAKGGGGEGTNA